MVEDHSPQGQHVAHGLHVGDVLAGKYRVDRMLGQGGMGIVVAATHVILGEPVAIKLLTPAASQSAEAVTRFTREAQAAARIRSEFVARTHDVGELSTGAPYMVMEFLEGEDLAVRLRRQGPLPLEQAVRHVLQTSVAVAEAHGHGIVHRDLKPSNLFVVRRSDGVETVKVVDFGISKSTTTTNLAMTGVQVMMGTPLYASPEQMRSAADVDARTDIWSLGVILFELLAGTTPFVAPTFEGLLALLLTSPPRRLRELRPDVPPALEAVVDRCLEKTREARFATVADFARAVAAAVLLDAEETVLVQRIDRHQRVSGGPPPAEVAPSIGSPEDRGHSAASMQAAHASPSAATAEPYGQRQSWGTDLAAASTRVGVHPWGVGRRVLAVGLGAVMLAGGVLLTMRWLGQAHTSTGTDGRAPQLPAEGPAAHGPTSDGPSVMPAFASPAPSVLPNTDAGAEARSDEPPEPAVRARLGPQKIRVQPSAGKRTTTVVPVERPEPPPTAPPPRHGHVPPETAPTKSPLDVSLK